MAFELFKNKPKKTTGSVRPIEKIELLRSNEVAKTKDVVTERRVGHPSQVVGHRERVSAKKWLHLLIRATSKNAVCMVLVEV